MVAFIFRLPIAAVCCLPALVCAHGAEPSVTIRKLDPDTRVGDLLNNSDKTCHIIVRDGTRYEVCPFQLPMDIERQIDKLEAQ